MNIINFIKVKKSGGRHTAEDISRFIDGLMSGDIPDYQAVAWLMAVNFNGLDDDETVALTKAIVDSGQVAEYIGLPGPLVDKHSTGGVGDKVTLILLPILAEMGMYVPKHSGRALGFTGGTIDKLESIEGFDAFPTEEDFKKVVTDIGFAIGGQTADVCPADGILYSLRDATATVDETGLIAASVVSKKIAGGAENILIDVKVGKGAFMQNIEDAEELSRRMIHVGEALGKRIHCLLTTMDEPLGYAVGNALELVEVVDCLSGKGPSDIMAVCKEAAVELASMSGLMDREAAAVAFDASISSGSALDRFGKFITARSGEISWIGNPQNLNPADRIEKVNYRGNEKYVKAIDALAIGEMVRRMGGGRFSKDDEIDHSVGVVLRMKSGDRVKGGETIGMLHLRADHVTSEWAAVFEEAFTFDDARPDTIGPVLKTIGK